MKTEKYLTQKVLSLESESQRAIKLLKTIREIIIY